MSDLNISDAEIYETGIGIGGEDAQLQPWD
jgi:hypothetical protein